MNRRCLSRRLPGCVLLTAFLLVLLSSSYGRQLSGLISWGQSSHKAEGHDPPSDKLWIEPISWEPRALILHNFLSEYECAYLIQKATPTMLKSEVVDNESGKSVNSRVRTSSGMFLERNADDTVRQIEERIALHSKIPVDHGEGLQVLHYQVGELYQAHWDYFHDQVNVQNGGQRVATMLMYLTDVDEGGETVFPNSLEKPHKGDASFQACAQQGVNVRPRKGDALLFYSLQPNGQLDPQSLHAGCPVIKGNKWSATKWMRVHTYAS